MIQKQKLSPATLRCIVDLLNYNLVIFNHMYYRSIKFSYMPIHM